jgi:hypothetical protein
MIYNQNVSPLSKQEKEVNEWDDVLIEIDLHKRMFLVSVNENANQGLVKDYLFLSVYAKSEPKDDSKDEDHPTVYSNRSQPVQL